jgi:hypothetical protein
MLQLLRSSVNRLCCLSLTSQSPLQSFCASVHPAKPISFSFAGFAGDRLRGALAHAGDLGAIRYFEFAVSQKQSASMKAANTL